MLDNILPEADLLKLRQLLSEAQRIIVTCHVSPDGDALGSMLAFSHYLWKRGKNVFPVSPNPFPDFLKWMPGADRIQIYEKHEEELAPVIAKADLMVCVDFNALDRLAGLQDVVAAHPAPKVLIDHHLSPEDFCQVQVSHPQMSSTCELLYSVLWQIDDYREDFIGHEEATCLYTGMMTDTGCFSYNSNRGDIYFIIGKLLDKGIDKDKIYRNVFYDYSPDRFRLLGYMLYVKMDIFPEYNASLMTLTREEQRRFSHKKGDTEGFVNVPLQIRGARLSVFLRENTEDSETIRVSLRSVDDFPCNKMAAEFFNGGGHLNASGGELKCSMEEAIEVVKAALRKYAPLLKNKKK